jgi:chromosome segregation ATPase
MKITALAAMFLIASNGLAQTPAKEPDTLQSLLVEVHQLRLDIEAMTAASQRVQIALYALQMQDGAVARSAQRLDSVHNACKGAMEARQHSASEIPKVEAELAAGTNDANRLRDLQSFLAQTKTSLELHTTEVQECQAAEAEATTQLRNDQAKLVDLQDRIERLDKTLEKLGGAGK